MLANFRAKLDLSFDHQPCFCAVHGLIGFINPYAEVQQSKGEAVITLSRQSGTRGRVVVPWSVKADTESSPYSVSNFVSRSQSEVVSVAGDELRWHVVASLTANKIGFKFGQN